MRKLFFLSLALGVCVTGLTFAQDDAAAPQPAESATAAETAVENAEADAANSAVEIAEPAAEAIEPADGGEEFAPPPGPPRHHMRHGHHRHHPRGEFGKDGRPAKDGERDFGPGAKQDGRPECDGDTPPGPPRHHARPGHHRHHPRGECGKDGCPAKEDGRDFGPGAKHGGRPECDGGAPPEPPRHHMRQEGRHRGPHDGPRPCGKFGGERCPRCGFPLSDEGPNEDIPPAEESTADANTEPSAE